MRASSRDRREEGTRTVSCEAVIPLRMRVRKSAVGSVIDMRSPAALGHSGDEALAGQLAQADPAQAELAIHRPCASAALAARVGAGLVLGGALLAHTLGGLGHVWGTRSQLPVSSSLCAAASPSSPSSPSSGSGSGLA